MIWQTICHTYACTFSNFRTFYCFLAFSTHTSINICPHVFNSSTSHFPVILSFSSSPTFAFKSSCLSLNISIIIILNSSNLQNFFVDSTGEGNNPKCFGEMSTSGGGFDFTNSQSSPPVFKSFQPNTSTDKSPFVFGAPGIFYLHFSFNPSFTYCFSFAEKAFCYFSWI